MRPSEIDIRPPSFREPVGGTTPTRIRLAGTGRFRSGPLGSVPIATSPDRGHVVMSLGPAPGLDYALPDLEPGDRLEIAAELEVCLDPAPGMDDGSGPPPEPAGVPYDYAPHVVAALRLVPGGPRGRAVAGAPIAIGRGTPLRLSPGQRRGRLFIEESFTVPDDAGTWFSDAELELILSASHEDAAPGQLLLLGNGPARGTGTSFAQITVARLRPGTVRLPTGEETKQLRARELPTSGDAACGVHSLLLIGLRRDEQLMVRTCVRASSARREHAARVGMRVFLADAPGQLEPDERGYAALVSSSAGRLMDEGNVDCLPGSRVLSCRGIGVTRILQNAIRPLYVNVVAVAEGLAGNGQDGSVDLIQGGWLNVVRIAPSSSG